MSEKVQWATYVRVERNRLSLVHFRRGKESKFTRCGKQIPINLQPSPRIDWDDEDCRPCHRCLATTSKKD